MFGDNEPTPLRRAIIAAYDRSPDADPATIAEECGCSTSYARKSIEHHRG